MPSNPSKSLLEKELSALREEITELRAVESMHKQAQEGLHAIELQLAGIIHSAMDAIITVDKGQRILLFNAAAEKMFGCSAKEVVGQSIDRFIPSRHRQDHIEHIKKFGEASVTNRRMGSLGSISGIRTNGEEFPIEASISHIKTGGEHLFTVILRDITERIKAEQALQESQRTLSTLIGNLPGMVYRCNNDSDRTMEFVSGHCQGLTGYAPEELIENRRVSYGRDLIVKGATATQRVQTRIWYTLLDHSPAALARHGSRDRDPDHPIRMHASPPDQLRGVLHAFLLCLDLYQQAHGSGCTAS